MAADPRVLGLLEEMLDAGKTPEEVCRGCPELLTEVQERWGEFRLIDAAVVELLPGLRTVPGVGEITPLPAAADLPRMPGYELSGEIGRGGMGVVYKARDLSLDRDVAVKLLQDGYSADSPIARRFADEARITAQLQHPGIPPVHDLGNLPDGRPFLAMKLIKGSTLDHLLDARADPAHERGRFVAAFEQVCQAVGYAHSHNVIHRDLKPSNVMVGAFGEVQVMDWGLAKVLTARGSSPGPPDTAQDTAAGTAIRPARGAEHETQAGSVMGTPAYMPPEQAIGAVDRIDARSDVFSLGGILCAVLTGRPPYVANTAEAIRQLAARARLDDAHSRLAACGAEPGLVALCLRCLAPEPDDRPRDGGEVAAAVAGLRAAAEERARQAEFDRVRAAEQGKRRRMLLAASGAVVVVLLAGLGASLWQTRRALRAEAEANDNADEAGHNARQARAERDAKDVALAAERRARRDEAKARQQAFAALRSMTAEVVERKFAQGAVLTEDDRAFLRGIIAQFDAFAAIKGDHADSRAVRAEGRSRVGTMRYRLGELRESLENYDQALSIRERLAADFPSRPEFRDELARSLNARGVLLSDTGRLKDAVKDFDEALSIYKRLAADFPSRPEFRQDLAGSHMNRGRLLYSMRRLKEAEQDYDQALNIYKRLAADFPSRPEFRHNLARSHIGRGVLLKHTGRLKEAERDYDQAVGIQSQLAADFPSRPEFRQDLATSHNNRGVLLTDTGRLKDAVKDYDQALSIRERLAADLPNRPDLRYDLASTCVNLADLHLENGNWAAAKRLLLQGRPHHLAALTANPRHPAYRQFYRNHLGALTVAHAGLLEREDAVGTAQTRRDLGWDAPADAYDAACFLSLCVSIVAKHDKLDATQRKEAAQFYGDAVMKLLRTAASKGYKDVARIKKKDTDLDPLRPRDDFRKLVAELEGKGK